MPHWEKCNYQILKDHKKLSKCLEKHPQNKLNLRLHTNVKNMVKSIDFLIRVDITIVTQTRAKMWYVPFGNTISFYVTNRTHYQNKYFREYYHAIFSTP